MGPSHAGVFSQVNRKKTPRPSSTLVLGASHSSPQPHQVFILRQERVGREMNSYTPDLATAGCGTAIPIPSSAGIPKEDKNITQTARIISGT